MFLENVDVQVVAMVTMCFKAIEETSTFCLLHNLTCICLCLPVYCGRQGSITVSALVSGSSGPGLSPVRGHCVCHSSFL